MFSMVFGGVGLVPWTSGPVGGLGCPSNPSGMVVIAGGLLSVLEGGAIVADFGERSVGWRRWVISLGLADALLLVY